MQELIAQIKDQADQLDALRLQRATAKQPDQRILVAACNLRGAVENLEADVLAEAARIQAVIAAAQKEEADRLQALAAAAALVPPAPVIPAPEPTPEPPTVPEVPADSQTPE